MIERAIFGCGGAGIEVLSLLHDLGWTFDGESAVEGIAEPTVGFYDDRKPPHVPFKVGYETFPFPVLGDLDTACRDAGATDSPFFVVGVGCLNMPARSRIAHDLSQAGARFFNAVHPQAALSRFLKMGTGNIVMAGVVIQARVVVGHHCFLCQSATVGHDCTLGSNVYLSPQANLCGYVSVGDGTLIGASAVILPCIHVGAGATVGAGAVVTRDVPDGATVMGNPAEPRGVFLNRRRS